MVDLKDTKNVRNIIIQLENFDQLIKGVNWTILEDRLFDVNSLDHPGGRFIIEAITDREISRYLFGNMAFDLYDTSRKIQHQHTNFALNYLESR